MREFMQNLKVHDLIRNYNDIILRCIYLLHLFVSFNTYLNVTYLPKVSLIFLMLITVIAFGYQIINIKNFISKKRFYLVIFFILSYAVSMCFYLNNNFYNNVKCIMWIIILLFLIYLYFPHKEKVNIYKEIKILSILSVFYITIVNIIGFILMYFNISVFKTALDGSVQFYGFWWGRLYGLFNDPNHGAVISVIGIFLAIGLYNKELCWKKKFLIVLSIFIQFFYITFSDSRTAIVSLICGCIVFLFFNFILTYRLNFKNFTKFFLTIILCTTAILLLNKTIKLSYNYIISSSSNNTDKDNSIVRNGINSIKITSSNFYEGKIENNSKIYMNNSVVNFKTSYGNNQKRNVLILELNNEESNHLEIGREQDISGDISNRRFSIWKSGIDLFAESPLIGVGGYSNIVTFAQENIPTTYLVANDYKIFDSFHNSFLDILVSQGFIGFSIFLLLMILNIHFLFKNLKYLKEDSYIISIFLSIISCVLVSSFFISNIMYVNSIESFYFWCFLGYLNYYITTNIKQEEKI